MDALIEIKNFIVSISGLSRTILHIYIGTGGFLLLSWMAKWPMANGRAFLAIALVEILNEINDVLVVLFEFGGQIIPFNLHRIAWPPYVTDTVLPNSAQDIVHTLAIPLVLVLCARKTDILSRRR